jgi:hypothetical protein
MVLVLVLVVMVFCSQRVSSKLDHKEVGYERFMELAQDPVQWRALVVMVLDHWVLLSRHVPVCMYLPGR